ncbi:hypothetical protein L3V59_33130 [Burkholderia aenigmatica]|uniref:hypothetical protein n=1 Tax=Burkholderia aenigmatica TaxID=2015348 RepID=UPI001F34C489|nr:hypothetical protein [Burkholderia aenigmatica]UKD14510.1 hypothetical protein L3V59_33130 [Burkholderia aenigmatica]
MEKPSARRHAAFAAPLAAGAAPRWAPPAQVVGAGASAPKGVQAENGLPQVNINRLGDALNDTGQSTENRSRGRCFVSYIDKKRE